jgi:hypothetical protein
MAKHNFPPPLKEGTRSREEIRKAVRTVMNDRGSDDWELLKDYPLAPPPPGSEPPPPYRDEEELPTADKPKKKKDF